MTGHRTSVSVVMSGVLALGCHTPSSVGTVPNSSPESRAAPIASGPTPRRARLAGAGAGRAAHAHADAEDGRMGMVRRRRRAGAARQFRRRGHRCARCRRAIRRRSCAPDSTRIASSSWRRTSTPRARRSRPGPGGHILTGPIFVEGADSGDVLEVRFKSIRPAIDYACNSFGPRSGFLPEDFPGKSQSKIIELDTVRMLGHFAPSIVDSAASVLWKRWRGAAGVDRAE